MTKFYFQMLKNWTQPEKLKTVCECNDIYPDKIVKISARYRAESDITVIEIEEEDDEDQAQSD